MFQRGSVQIDRQILPLPPHRNPVAPDSIDRERITGCTGNAFPADGDIEHSGFQKNFRTAFPAEESGPVPREDGVPGHHRRVADQHHSLAGGELPPVHGDQGNGGVHAGFFDRQPGKPGRRFAGVDHGPFSARRFDPEPPVDRVELQFARIADQHALPDFRSFAFFLHAGDRSGQREGAAAVDNLRVPVERSVFRTALDLKKARIGADCGMGRVDPKTAEQRQFAHFGINRKIGVIRIEFAQIQKELRFGRSDIAALEERVGEKLIGPQHRRACDTEAGNVHLTGFDHDWCFVGAESVPPLKRGIGGEQQAVFVLIPVPEAVIVFRDDQRQAGDPGGRRVAEVRSVFPDGALLTDPGTDGVPAARMLVVGVADDHGEVVAAEPRHVQGGPEVVLPDQPFVAQIPQYGGSGPVVFVDRVETELLPVGADLVFAEEVGQTDPGEGGVLLLPGLIEGGDSAVFLLQKGAEFLADELHRLRRDIARLAPEEVRNRERLLVEELQKDDHGIILPGEAGVGIDVVEHRLRPRLPLGARLLLAEQRQQLPGVARLLRRDQQFDIPFDLAGNRIFDMVDSPDPEEGDGEGHVNAPFFQFRKIEVERLNPPRVGNSLLRRPAHQMLIDPETDQIVPLPGGRLRSPGKFAVHIGHVARGPEIERRIRHPHEPHGNIRFLLKLESFPRHSDHPAVGTGRGNVSLSRQIEDGVFDHHRRGEVGFLPGRCGGPELLLFRSDRHLSGGEGGSRDNPDEIFRRGEFDVLHRFLLERERGEIEHPLPLRLPMHVCRARVGQMDELGPVVDIFAADHLKVGMAAICVVHLDLAGDGVRPVPGGGVEQIQIFRRKVLPVGGKGFQRGRNVGGVEDGTPVFQAELHSAETDPLNVKAAHIGSGPLAGPPLFRGGVGIGAVEGGGEVQTADIRRGNGQTAVAMLKRHRVGGVRLGRKGVRTEILVCGEEQRLPGVCGLKQARQTAGAGGQLRRDRLGIQRNAPEPDAVNAAVRSPLGAEAQCDRPAVPAGHEGMGPRFPLVDFRDGAIRNHRGGSSGGRFRKQIRFVDRGVDLQLGRPQGRQDEDRGPGEDLSVSVLHETFSCGLS